MEILPSGYMLATKILYKTTKQYIRSQLHLNRFFILFIALNTIELIASHGLYPEEKTLGNHFVVNISVGIADESSIKDISDTIDYLVLFQIIKKHFDKPVPLLETLLQSIEKEIIQHYNIVKYLNLSIHKKNPPMGAQIASSEVRLEKYYQ